MGALKILSSVFILLSLIISGCTDRSKKNTEASTPAKKPEVVADDKSVNAAPADDYALLVNNQEISLKKWEHEIDLEKILGKPRSEKAVVLGEGADTHRGAIIKDKLYQGLKIQLYAPRSKDSGWILNMVVSSDQYKTGRGTKVGDDTGKIKKLYPELKRWPDGKRDKTNSPLFMSGPDNKFLKFNISKGRVQSIELYYEIQ